MLEHIERLKTFQLVDLPEGLGLGIHQNRLLKLAREGGQMTPKDLGKFEPQRRYATLAAVVLESTATVIDELVDLHDRILVKLFSGAKHKHQQQFQKQGKAINDKVRLYSDRPALLEAKESGSDPYAAIEAVIPWDEFTESVSEAELLARPEGFDHLHLVGENFATLRRYTPTLLEVLELRAAPHRARRAGSRADPARDERRQPAQGAYRCTHGLHQAALEAAGDHPGRPRPEILRNLRPVRAEERPALRRHLGQGLAAVPRLRRLPAA